MRRTLLFLLLLALIQQQQFAAASWAALLLARHGRGRIARKKFLKHYASRRGLGPRRRPHWRPHAHRPDVHRLDLFNLTGVLEPILGSLYDRVKDRITEPRLRPGMRGYRGATVLSPFMRLCIVLHSLRTGARLSDIGREFNLSASTISRDRHHIIPILAEELDEIHFPENPPTIPFEGVCGAVDCSSHPHTRGLRQVRFPLDCMQPH